ncbi:MAG: hypothetical protein ABI903_09670 [Actinomycetota bacterium]
MTSAARVGPRALTRPTSQAPRLRVVTGAPARRSGAALVVVCATLLATGLIGLLLLNTALAQGSFTLHDLRTTSDQLTDAKGALNESLDASKSPANLAKKALGMGMVPAQSAAFLRLSDGKVIGVAQQAPARPGLSAGATSPAPVTAAVRRAGTTSPHPVAMPAKAAPLRAVAKAAKPSKPAKPGSPESTAVKAPQG